MKQLLLFLCLNITFIAAFSQDSPSVNTANSAETEKYWENWVKNLYEVGVEQTKDSIKISADVKQVILDTAYRRVVYPPAYTIPAAGALMKKMEIKQAMWYLINVYQNSKESRPLVLKIILPFEQGLEMDKVLISTFYTYAMTDPQVGSFRNGRIEISRPDLLEQKFNIVKEMVGYIISQRKVVNNNAEKSIGPAKSEALKNLGKSNAKIPVVN